MSTSITRLFDIPEHQLNNYPKEDALAAKINGEWITTSTEDYVKKIRLTSLGLIKLGIQPGDKVGIISNNRPEWHVLDMAILQIGAINVPIYPTISEEDYTYIFNDAGIKMCFTSSEELYRKVSNIFDKVDSLKSVYTIEQVEGATNWEEIFSNADTSLEDELTKRKNQIKSEDLATLIYTSGTTGKPKGVMLSHNNLISNVLASVSRLPVHHQAKALSFLPICHVYERMLTYVYQYVGVSIYFAESLETIGDNLKEVKPDVFTAVPRLLEKVYDKIMAKGSELTGIKRKLFFWAVELGEEYDVKGKSAWYKFKLKIARKLIFSKWQEALGGNCKAVASGSAALQPRLARIYLAAGIPIMEGYGLSETSPVISVNCEVNDGVRIGTVGRVLENLEVKIAEDGEILVKGPSVMMGYYNLPEKTREELTEDGWFHTGDIGLFEEGEYLKITDRKKEIFKTSGGKYIAPQVMENKFKESRFIAQIVIIGENQKHPAALIVPDFDFVKSWAKRKGTDIPLDQKEMILHTNVIERIQKEIDKYNSFYGGWEQIKRFELLDHELSIESGELTPTLKLKRKVIMEKYQNLIAGIYS